MPEKGPWGGRRPGSGRPLKGSTPRQRVSYALPADQIEQIERLANVMGLNKSEAVSWLVGQAFVGLPDHVTSALTLTDIDPSL